MAGQKFEAQLMIVADKTTPYRLLTEVLYSCGQAGYANYRLLVLKAATSRDRVASPSRAHALPSSTSRTACDARAGAHQATLRDAAELQPPPPLHRGICRYTGPRPTDFWRSSPMKRLVVPPPSVYSPASFWPC